MFKLLELVKLGFTKLLLTLPFSITHRTVVLTAAAAASLTALSAYLACYVALSVSITALIGSPGEVGSGASSRSWLHYIGMFVPSNWSGLLSLLISAYVCRAAYVWTREQVDMWSKG